MPSLQLSWNSASYDENVALTVNCEFSVTYSTNADIHITVFQNEKKKPHCKRLVEIAQVVVAIMVVLEM